MNKTNPNDPAFPNIVGIRQTHDQCWPETVGGLSKMELFTGLVMVGLVSKDGSTGYDLTNANRAVEQAKAIIYALNKNNEGGDKKEYE